MSHERPGDFLRDHWEALFRAESERRGWAFKRVTPFGGPVANQKDNTGFSLEILPSPGPDFGEPSSGGTQRPSGPSQFVYLLVHASDHSMAWSVSGEQLATVSRVCGRRGGRFVILLLNGEPEAGFLARPDDVPYLRRSRLDALAIGRVDLSSLVAFSSIEQCAKVIERTPMRPARSADPGKLAVTRRGPPPVGRCPKHGMNWKPFSDKWACPVCERDGRQAGEPPS